MNLFKFNDYEEKQYKSETYKNDLHYIRITLIICVLFYSLFGIMDFIVDIPNPWTYFNIRFFVVNPIFVIGIVLSYHKSFFKLHQLLMTIAYTFAGLGIVAMLLINPLNFSYYCGLFLIFAVGHLLTKIHFFYISIGSFIIVLIYTLAVPLFLLEQNPHAYHYLVFYIAVYILNVFGSYIQEKYKRDKFKQVFTLRDSKVILEKENYNRLIQVDNSNKITTLSLAKLAEARDKLTGDHIERVGELSLKLALRLNDSIYKKNKVNKQNLLNSIELASTLHDIGKISIPENILMKPGPLTSEEMKIMKTHSEGGYEMLNAIHDKYDQNNFINMGLDICKCHHERWDGTGYPNGLKTTQIPLSARIVAIVDVFDALISKRPYKKPFSLEKSLDIIKNERSKMFDPDLVDAFIELYN